MIFAFQRNVGSYTEQTTEKEWIICRHYKATEDYRKVADV
jgi:hypothetical protein